MKMNCPECGNIRMAYLDGYAVGDVLLEGVRFEVAISDGQIKVRTHPDDADYMSDLNEKKWIAEARKVADGYDNFECPVCGSEVAMI